MRERSLWTKEESRIRNASNFDLPLAQISTLPRLNCYGMAGRRQVFRVTDPVAYGDGEYSGSSSGLVAAAEEDGNDDDPPPTLTRSKSQELLRGGGTCAGDGDL